jgi:hypothetical protein
MKDYALKTPEYFELIGWCVPLCKDSVRQYKEILRPAIKSGGVIPLRPRHAIYLTVVSGNGPRFADAFHATWKRLPLWVRRRLLRYWRNHPRYGAWPSPFISIQSVTSEGRKNYGLRRHYGCEFEFASKYTDILPENVLQDLIAHELAHALQCALGIHCVRKYSDGRALYATRDGGPFGGNYEIEEDADLWMNRWGFDSESIDVWSLEAGNRKVVQISDGDFGRIYDRMMRTGR